MGEPDNQVQVEAIAHDAMLSVLGRAQYGTWEQEQEWVVRAVCNLTAQELAAGTEEGEEGG